MNTTISANKPKNEPIEATPSPAYHPLATIFVGQPDFWLRPAPQSLLGFGFALKALPIRQDDFLVVHPDQASGLEAIQIAGNDFTHCAQIQRDLLVRPGQVECLALRQVGQFEKRPGQPLADFTKGDTLYQGYETPQAPADDCQRLQWQLRVLITDRPEIALVDEQREHIVDGLCRSRIGAAVEKR